MIHLGLGCVHCDLVVYFLIKENVSVIGTRYASVYVTVTWKESYALMISNQEHALIYPESCLYSQNKIFTTNRLGEPPPPLALGACLGIKKNQIQFV